LSSAARAAMSARSRLSEPGRSEVVVSVRVSLRS
jgi:hypothetical protein